MHLEIKERTDSFRKYSFFGAEVSLSKVLNLDIIYECIVNNYSILCENPELTKFLPRYTYLLKIGVYKNTYQIWHHLSFSLVGLVG